MERSTVLRPLLAALWLCLGGLTLLAQGGKVSVLLVPKPNQAVHYRLTQEMDLTLTMSFEGAPPPGPAPMAPRKMFSKTSFYFTQKMGKPDEQGRVEAEATFGQVTGEIIMDGTPMPVGDLGGKVAGKKFTIVYDRQGKVVDLKMPDGLGLETGALRQMMMGLYANLPTTSLGIGETAVTPFSMAPPIPLPGAGPLNLTGQSRLKLLAIDHEGADRLAKFEQSLEGAMVSSFDIPSPQATIKMNLDFRMSGAGGLQLNLDKGVVKSSEMQATINGRMTTAGGPSPASIPNVSLQGTTRATVTGSY